MEIMGIIVPVVAILGAYMFGSFPFSYLIAIMNGTDLRIQGSGNCGATNIYRLLGLKWAIVAYALDMAKGIIPVAIVWHVFGWSSWLAMGVGLAAILGHVFPILTNTRGKGISTTSGVFLILHPVALLIGLFIWTLVFTGAGRKVSLASLFAISLVCGLELMTALLGWRQDAWPATVLTLTVFFLAIFSHRGNIGRLLAGKEGSVR